ncbi:hydroxymethylglutaryl-CoA lyase [Streptomyces sp. Ru87]|uniref:hydroxymethylglutaryl-CoA lyase n=1 Tax=Streptomyces sp. Ru87 TaxID=2044307 RepID=UPI00211D6ED9|nr:hydroxymethylglutaryl-CoA lyase [Streptomyces sp. Ru87]
MLTDLGGAERAPGSPRTEPDTGSAGTAAGGARAAGGGAAGGGAAAAGRTASGGAAPGPGASGRAVPGGAVPGADSRTTDSRSAGCADAASGTGRDPGAGARGPRPAPRLPVLVPNERGLERALALGVRDIAVFGSATESFARANLNRTVAESLAMFEPVVARAAEAGARVRGYLSMCFGDPWEGAVPAGQVVRAARALLDMGCDELSLGDTIGVATPGQVTALLAALGAAGVPVSRIAVHFHDTYGQALANTLAALQYGVTTVDASAGGLGGCPYAKSATGNLATEDLVWMLHGLGIETGVDLGRLTATSVWMAAHLGRTSPSRTVRALAGAPSDQER